MLSFVVTIQYIVTDKFFSFTSADDEYPLQFINSPWATPCLIVKDYMYNCHSRKNGRGYWRCHNYSKKMVEQRCRARCVILNGRIQAMTGGEHKHPPHTEKISKILLRNQMVNLIPSSEQAASEAAAHELAYDERDEHQLYLPKYDAEGEDHYDYCENVNIVWCSDIYDLYGIQKETCKSNKK